MAQIKCVINTPISEASSKDGDMIVLPGADGELGVLYNHISMIAELTHGKVCVYNNNKLEQEIEIDGGIAYIKKDIIEIFCS
jgi:F0F1-type ATP synthase epsilon subunit